MQEIGMGIIKLELNVKELNESLQRFHKSRRQTLEKIADDFKSELNKTFNQLLNAEMTLFLGRADQITNKKNGYEYKDYVFKGIGSLRVKVPVDRNRNFESLIIPKKEQIDPRLKEDLAVLHLAGISTRTLALISKRILGIEISKQTVGNSLRLIEKQAEAWLTRPIEGRYWALYIDGTNFKIQRRRSTESEPSLVVLGIDENNRRSLLSVEPGTKDNVEAWEAVFNELIKRGLDSSFVKIGVMDGLPGLENLFSRCFPNSVTGRCWVHAMRNAIPKTPKRLREPFRELAHKVMYASSEATARTSFRELKLAMNRDATRAVNCLEKDLDSLLTHYKFPKETWAALKTTNPIERINKEFKRRFKSMGSIGEQSLRCLVAFTALRLEMNWRTTPIDSKKLANLKNIHHNVNVIESTMTELLN